ncbi:MAG TPA: VOC family protein [Puia sp.]|nr:VOC family protein [Puia sp.]
MLGKYALMAFVSTAEPATGRAFYEEKLGLTVTSVDDYGVMYDAGGTTLRMSFVRELHPAPYSILSWMVRDIHSVMKGLKAKGVVFEMYEGLGQDEAGVWTAPGGTKVAWFKDPGGNLLSLSEING